MHTTATLQQYSKVDLERSQASMHRISEAFPPDDNRRRFLVAPIHDLLEFEDLENFNMDDVVLRDFVRDTDMEEIKLLHKEWFPVEYDEDFFETIQQEAVSTLMAVWYSPRLRRDFIIGLVIYEIQAASPSYMEYGISELCSGACSLYIMTLGTVKEFRQKGIATVLLERLVAIANRDNRIRTVYLDAIDYNASAHRFYEKNGFARVKSIPNHYTLNEKNYSAYVYCRYFHGGKPSSVSAKPSKYGEFWRACLSYTQLLFGCCCCPLPKRNRC